MKKKTILIIYIIYDGNICLFNNFSVSIIVKNTSMVRNRKRGLTIHKVMIFYDKVF